MKLDILLGWATGHGGVETVTTLLAQCLAAGGHDVRVFQSRPPMHPEWEQSLPNGLYYYDPVATGHPLRFVEEPEAFRYSLGYRSLIDRIGWPDTILAAHTPLLSIVARLAVGAGPDAPLVVSWLHGPPDSYGDPSGLWMADGHLAISSEIGERIRQVTQERRPVFVIGNPVPLPSTTIERPTNHPEILYVGRLENQQKNLDLLAAALTSLATAKRSWHATIIGDGPDGPAFTEQVEPLVRQGRLTIMGWQADPWASVKTASVLVLTSNFEGFGLVLVEALARGIPVLSTDCIGPKDIVQPDVNGWLVPVGDARLLSQRLLQIVDGSLALPSPEMCRQTAQRFDPERVTQRILQSLDCMAAFRSRVSL